MAYGDFKELPRRTASDKVLCNKPFTIASNPQYDKIFFDKKAGDIIIHTGAGTAISLNQQLANELHKPIIRKFKKSKVYLFY